jgi:two-component system, NarL family, nitrate/nitrite response regulator NarL
VPAPVVTVFLVSEVRLYRDGIGRLLEQREDIDVVGTAATHLEARSLLADATADVVLLDAPLALGEEALRWLGVPHQKVVVLAVLEDEDEVIAWAEAGAVGYVSRDGSSDDLIATIKAVARGETLCSPRMVAALLRRLASVADGSRPRSPISSDDRLTPRERQVANLIGQGLSNKEIARRLCIELPTVKNHVHNILRKLEVSRRGQAAAYLTSAR